MKGLYSYYKYQTRENNERSMWIFISATVYIPSLGIKLCSATGKVVIGMTISLFYSRHLL